MSFGSEGPPEEGVLERLGNLAGSPPKNPLDQWISYSVRTWTGTHRKSELVRLMESVRYLDDGGGNPIHGRINRRHLVELARPVLDEPCGDAAKLLMVACQAWGGGTGDNRAAWRIECALQDPRSAHVLQRIHHAVTVGPVGQVVRLGLGRWGTSFVTKYAWAVAEAHRPGRPTALIRDRNVNEALLRIGWDDRTAAGSRNLERRYQAYVEAAHRWADWCGTTPTGVERMLFTVGKR